MRYFLLLVPILLGASSAAEAPPSGTPETRLGTLPVVSARQGWGSLRLDKSVAEGPLVVAGQTFPHGFGTHSNSEIAFDLDGGYDIFRACVGVDDFLKNHPEAPKASVVFQVFADNAKVFDSGVMKMGDKAKPVEAKVTGASELRLVVADAGDGINCDHADWGEPVLLGAGPVRERPAAVHEVKARDLVVRLSRDGQIVGLAVGGSRQEWPLLAKTVLAGCRRVGETVVSDKKDELSFTRTLEDAASHRATMTERFTPAGEGVRWDVEIAADGPNWSAPVVSRFLFEKPESKLFWTAWGSPDFNGTQVEPDLAKLVEAAKASASPSWSDPLVGVAFPNHAWHYGNVTQNCPVGTDYVALPLMSVLDPKSEAGLSVVLSPEDVLLDLDLSVSSSGHCRWTRTNHRLGGSSTARFTLFLVPHEADWRGGLRFLTARFPRFFDPPNPRSHRFAGCGAYSIGETTIDAERFRRMAFGFNWKLSDDFPYMGMFVPPVKNQDEAWERSCDERSADQVGRTTTCRRMNDYAASMKRDGFGVLSYFNVTEFGKNMYGRKPVRAADDPELWKDPAAFLQHKLPQAVVDPRITTCYNAHIVDCGDPAYQAFILEQIRRNIDLLPATDGICIDRADWLRLYNRHADDGVSWIEGRPARSLFRSWLALMEKMGPRMHAADKLIYSNMMTMRLELCRELDGLYTEFGNNGNALNASSLLGLRKPVVCWTYNETLGQPAPDAFMQRHLHMGCFPTAPYPYNNHCINPEPKADQLYLDYGPMLDCLRGKKWILAPHCVGTATPGVKVNLFEVPYGYVVPVTFGGQAESAELTIRNLPALGKLRARVLHPGTPTAQPLESRCADGILRLAVPLQRGCAVVKLEKS